MNGTIAYADNAAYLRAVDAACEDRLGVGCRALIEIAPSLASSGALRRAMAERLAPDAFAVALGADYGFKVGGSEAGQYNLFRAAVIEFAANGRWSLDGNGPATMQTSRGPLELNPVVKDGRVGFGVKLAGDAESHVRLDLGDAVKDMFQMLRNGARIPAAPSNDGGSGMRM
jgi:hypothetical protein